MMFMAILVCGASAMLGDRRIDFDAQRRLLENDGVACAVELVSANGWSRLVATAIEGGVVSTVTLDVAYPADLLTYRSISMHSTAANEILVRNQNHIQLLSWDGTEFGVEHKLDSAPIGRIVPMWVTGAPESTRLLLVQTEGELSLLPLTLESNASGAFKAFAANLQAFVGQFSDSVSWSRSFRSRVSLDRITCVRLDLARGEAYFAIPGGDDARSDTAVPHVVVAVTSGRGGRLVAVHDHLALPLASVEPGACIVGEPYRHIVSLGSAAGYSVGYHQFERWHRYDTELAVVPSYDDDGLADLLFLGCNTSVSSDEPAAVIVASSSGRAGVAALPEKLERRVVDAVHTDDGVLFLLPSPELQLLKVVATADGPEVRLVP